MATLTHAYRASLLAILVFASPAIHAQQGAVGATSQKPDQTRQDQTRQDQTRQEQADTRSRSLFGRAMEELVGAAVERSRGENTPATDAIHGAVAGSHSTDAAPPATDAAPPVAAAGEEAEAAGAPADLATTSIAAQSDPH